MLNYDLRLFSVVIVYLSREGNEKLKHHLQATCQPDTIIIAIGVRPSKIISRLHFDVYVSSSSLSL
jgi:hypothetical protein